MTDPSTRPLFDTILILASLACLALAFARFAGLSDARAALIHPGPDRWYLDGPGMPEGWAVRPTGTPVATHDSSGLPSISGLIDQAEKLRKDTERDLESLSVARRQVMALLRTTDVLDDLPDYWPVTITAGAFAGEPGTFFGAVGGIYAGETFYFIGLAGGRITAVAGSSIAAGSATAFDLADDAPVE